MEKIRQLSLRKSIVLYMTVSLVASFALSAVIVRRAGHVQEQIWSRYTDMERYFQELNKENMDYYVSVARPAAEEMDEDDRRLSELCDFLQTYSVLVCSILGSCGAVFLFYHNKLREPVRQLDEASRRIADNDLDFHVTYENEDELGCLCRQFERMRGQLMENNRQLWKNIEDERALRAAIAHDIRSPLSVLKGYQEMLLEYVPNGMLDSVQTVEMLSEGMHQIERMDTFVETMRRLNSLESRVLKKERVTAEELAGKIRAETEILAKGKEAEIYIEETEIRTDVRETEIHADIEETGIHCMKKTAVPLGVNASDVFYGDMEVIMEVVENIAANALRYAKTRIEIGIKLCKEELKICVRDDGEGFSETEDIGKQPFYRQNAKDSFLHAGLGMYISRLYCEKHGGALLAENTGQKGAAVTAVFREL